MFPNLPRKNNRREQKIDGKVQKWFEQHHPLSALIEVKMKGGKLADHQRKLLDKVAKTGEFSYKFPDGGLRTPLDIIVAKNIDAVLCICTEDGKCECTINNNHVIKIKV